METDITRKIVVGILVRGDRRECRGQKRESSAILKMQKTGRTVKRGGSKTSFKRGKNATQASGVHQEKILELLGGSDASGAKSLVGAFVGAFPKREKSVYFHRREEKKQGISKFEGVFGLMRGGSPTGDRKKLTSGLTAGQRGGSLSMGEIA